MKAHIGTHEHLTHRGNLSHTRYGWLRLTPAYSIHLVADLLHSGAASHRVVLDPFCGTGTTALVCAEQGVHCDTTDINPFLVWFSQVKTATYRASDIMSFSEAARSVYATIFELDAPQWTPAIHQIEKWWSVPKLAALSRMMQRIHELEAQTPERSVNLLKVAFCRVMIEHANVSFGHQSMSFKRASSTPMFDLLLRDEDWVAESWTRAVNTISVSALSAIMTEPRMLICDARRLTSMLSLEGYTQVITSPPYPNRMSYIRELRPYMYWLGYLSDAREAGEMDWQAIGGTWGIATSKVNKWTPELPIDIPLDSFPQLLDQISERSPLLARYVHKYFYDMVQHLSELFPLVQAGGSIHYIVGNSKFYDVVLPVERIFAAMFEVAGFEQSQITIIRKRTSKRELYEYVVSAKRPS